MSTAEIDAERPARRRRTSPSRAWRRRDRGSTRKSSARAAAGARHRRSAAGSTSRPNRGRASGISSIRGTRGRLARDRAFARHPVGARRRASPRDFVIRAAQSLEPWYRELLRVRTGLVTGSLAAVAPAARRPRRGARISLSPLRRLEHEIVDIEAGRRESLGTGWPRELAGVTGNLNALLVGERKRTRALSHDARQPRAQPQDAARRLQQPARAAARRARDALVPPLERMQAIVQHQLKRAVFGGSSSTLIDLNVQEPLEQLRSALAKVYADKSV